MDFLLAFIFAIVHPADTPGGPIPIKAAIMQPADTPGGPIPLTSVSQQHVTPNDTPGGPIPITAR
jgi:hypothetical protein